MTGSRPPETVARVLDQVDRAWRQSGVPRPERRVRLDELRTHLEDAVADGRAPQEVVGPDPVAFAAEWVHADRRRPVASVALRVVGVLLVVTGMLALTYVLAPDDLGGGRPGLTWSALVFALIPPALVLYREALTLRPLGLDVRRRKDVALAGIIAVAVLGGAAGARTSDALLPVPYPVASGLIVVGLLLLGWAWVMRLTPRTRRRV
ncbi:DUF1048 domain-containing protein [Actinotalea sp. C106]|uniref:DUF1048 domain-containing protein n=1 Tax=Actinotalea sp. C106 TaxID=2908644 RepID=UPI002027DC63|nr:DUF1048 domain-containing protein [Actinotalea sp. C106]